MVENPNKKSSILLRVNVCGNVLEIIPKNGGLMQFSTLNVKHADIWSNSLRMR